MSVFLTAAFVVSVELSCAPLASSLAEDLDIFCVALSTTRLSFTRTSTAGRYKIHVEWAGMHVGVLRG